MILEGHKNFAGNYVKGDSFLHRLKPETKILAALFLIAVSGTGGGWSLTVVGMLSLLGTLVARVYFKSIFYIIKRMAWFFLAIGIFPVLFTPGFYVDLPVWFPLSISREGLILGVESSARLINILLISLVLVRTTSSSDWMEGLEKLLGPLINRLPVIKDLFAVALLSVKLLPQILIETQEHFSDLYKNGAQTKWGYKKLHSFVHSVLHYIASIFSNLDRWSTEVLFEPQINKDENIRDVNHPNPLSK